MIEWRDEGILLSTRRHGETSAIIDVFTPEHGRHAGVVRGGTSRRIAPTLQPGAQLDLVWRARLDDHIGSFSVEPVRSRAAAALDSRQALAGLNSVTALVNFALPEREPHPPLYLRTRALLDLLPQQDLWPLAYVQWELMLLEDLGYGLSLERCAVTGAETDLAYVSPKSGRAVSRGAAGPWADRLLPLPAVLKGQGEGKLPEILEALETTGYFLSDRLAVAVGTKPLPDARARFLQVLARR